MIAIDYIGKDGTASADVFCEACASTHGADAIYDGDVRRPATLKDARTRDSNAGVEWTDFPVIRCDGCGAEEEAP